MTTSPATCASCRRQAQAKQIIQQRAQHGSAVTPGQPSRSELILSAAADLAQPFGREQLVVHVWNRFPKAFGLKGYQDSYPDANLVLSYLYGARGLVSRGLLRAAGVGFFEVVVPEDVP